VTQECSCNVKIIWPYLRSNSISPVSHLVRIRAFRTDLELLDSSTSISCEEAKVRKGKVRKTAERRKREAGAHSVFKY
jgi:hypothetical protein